MTAAPPSRSAHQLKAGQLGTADVTASTLANIGPGIDFYFAFGVIAVTAGVAAPLTIIAAGVAVGFLAFVVAEFSRMEPSAGSFITYVETSLGRKAGVLTALLLAVGFTVAIAGVFTMSGGMVTLTLDHYTSWRLTWEPLSLVLTVGAIWLTARGLRLSTRAVGLAVLLQVLIMVGVCIVVLVDQRAELSGVPFSWSHLSGGLVGLSAGFPLALYMYIGWENGPALAEEARDPTRTIPRALYLSLAIGTALFVLFAYSTVTGFHYDVSSIGRVSVPFLTMADRYLGTAAILAWIAGIVSVLATLVAGVNSQARVLFDGGRSGLLPAPLGRVRQPGDTPVNALASMGVAGLAIIGIWWVAHLVGAASGSNDPVGLYAECSTMGTILILFVYVLTAISLPVYMWRRHRDSFSPARHVVMPALGVLSLIVPFAELFKPGQPAPYSVFPYLAVAVLAAAAVTAWLVVRRNPSAGSGEGVALSGS
ncbi:MAG TPA: APC family permease [Solirubrobacteraceae bacterium]|nr:APC family permease [Solirubrobacteraceae bacterium]